MKHMHEISEIAISQNIPAVITNMIRSFDGKEFENMRKAIDIFTHVKIKLSKNRTKYHGEANWLLNYLFFPYTIDGSGLTEISEDF